MLALSPINPSPQDHSPPQICARPSTVAVKTSLRIFFRTPGHRCTGIRPSFPCTSKVCRIFPTNRSYWSIHENTYERDFDPLAFPFFLPLPPDFLQMAVIPSYLTCRRNGKRAIEEEMCRGGKRAHFESVKDGSCHDGGPRDGRTLMSRPAVPRRFASHLVGSSDVICDVECRRRYEIQIRSHGLHTSN